jgi:hypothetical protein
LGFPRSDRLPEGGRGAKGAGSIAKIIRLDAAKLAQKFGDRPRKKHEDALFLDCPQKSYFNLAKNIDRLRRLTNAFYP